MDGLAKLRRTSQERLRLRSPGGGRFKREEMAKPSATATCAKRKNELDTADE